MDLSLRKKHKIGEIYFLMMMMPEQVDSNDYLENAFLLDKN